MKSSPDTPSPFPLISTREVYRNPWISVREDRVTRPGGKEGLFGVVTMSGGSSVLAVTDEQEVFLTREYKYGIAAESLEVVSGGFDAGESPIEAAMRELEEEVGFTARHWIDTGVIHPFTTIVNSPNYLFIATGLEPTARRLDEGEIIHLERVPLQTAIDYVMNGRIMHGASCVLLLKAQRLLQSSR